MSEKCNAPKNCEPFDTPVFKRDSLHKIIQIWQEGKCIYSREGQLTIIHQSEEKIVFLDDSELQTTIYNRNGIIIIRYNEKETTI